MRGVDVKETAAVGAQLFDGNLRSSRPDRQHLLGLLDRLHDRVAGSILNRVAIGIRLGLLVAGGLQQVGGFILAEGLHHAL